MANKNNKALHDRYYRALVALGEKVTKRMRLETYRKKWKKLDIEYKERGEKRPTLAQADKIYQEHTLETDNITLEDAMDDYLNDHRDEYTMETPPADIDLDEVKAQDTIDLFLSLIDKIYSDTLVYIEENKEGKGHEGGKLASIADKHENREELNDKYFGVKAKVQMLLDEYPLKIVAQAIQDNVELDYAIAITLVYPSEVKVLFDVTIEQLMAIGGQMEQRAEELREEQERKYRGQDLK